jgi:voltage-gated potassium channel
MADWRDRLDRARRAAPARHALRVWRALSAENVPRLLGAFLLLLFAGGPLVYVLERGHNPMFRGPGDGLWWAIVTFTTIGYGDTYPVTGAGRLAAGALMLLGIGLLGLVTGKLAAALVERRIREGRGLGEARLSGHLVVIGWKSDMNEFVARLLEQPGIAPAKVVLVNAAGEGPNEELRRRHPGLGYVHAEMVDAAVLQRAHVGQARRVLVLADEAVARSDHERDARTVMTVMEIENLAPEVYTCAEVLDRSFAQHLRLARCDEVVLSRDHTRAMLLSATSATGLASLVDRLLAPGGGLATVPIPERFVGQPFRELAAHLRQEGGRLAIGLVENTGQVLAIKREALRAAQMTEDVGRLLDNLSAVRSIVPNRPLLNPPQDYVVPRHALAVVIGPGAEPAR